MAWNNDAGRARAALGAYGSWLKTATLAATAMLSSGCSVMSNHPSPLPRDGATMTDVYRTHMADEGVDGGSGSARNRLPLRGTDDDAVVAQRKALSEPLNNRFERLPNPDLTMHVFPHLAQGKYPVPGYETVFPMYDSVQYALPGEVAPRHQASGSFTAPAPTTGRMVAPADKEQASAEALRKRQRLAELAFVSPAHARVLADYDRLYAERCKTVLSTDELFAVPASGAPAFDAMLGHAAVGREDSRSVAGSELMRCDAPPRGGVAAPADRTKVDTKKAALKDPS